MCEVKTGLIAFNLPFPLQKRKRPAVPKTKGETRIPPSSNTTTHRPIIDQKNARIDVADTDTAPKPIPSHLMKSNKHASTPYFFNVTSHLLSLGVMTKKLTGSMLSGVVVAANRTPLHSRKNIAVA